MYQYQPIPLGSVHNRRFLRLAATLSTMPRRRRERRTPLERLQATEPGDWVTNGICYGIDAADIFFSSNPALQAKAAMLCANCPVKVDCFAYAVETRQPAGIWGGVLFDPKGPVVKQLIRA
jgi:hypothetical protein